MGNFIKNALLSVVKFFVTIVVSILAIAFLVVADVVALVLYPSWAWKNPDKAAQADSLTDVLNWEWLEDVINPHKSWKVDYWLLRFFQCIMRPIDAAVVKLWNAWFLHHSPIQKRKYFIDMLGNGLSSLPEKVQENYFCYGVDFDRQVYLVKNNMLSPEVLKKIAPYCDEIFVAAGKVSDAQFRRLNSVLVKKYAENFDLSLQKQTYLVYQLFYAPETYLPILRKYIMRKGLHPSAVEYFYNTLKEVEKPKSGVEELPKILLGRQDLVMVIKTNERRNQTGIAEVFAEYLKDHGLSFSAQVAMTPWQYEVFHKVGLKLLPKAVSAKLAIANKNTEAQQFVALMMRYGELEGNEVAMNQIAADEKLSALWLNHLAEHKTETA